MADKHKISVDLSRRQITPSHAPRLFIAPEQGLKSFDSGAQGEHKIQRGFEPIVTYSNHWIADLRFNEAWI